MCVAACLKASLPAGRDVGKTLAVIGLGNPGSEYDGTRHNIGFAVADAVARKLGTGFGPGRGEYAAAETGAAVIVKPLTYMNNSGVAVAEVLDRYGLGAQDMVVVCDDFHLPLGTLRLRWKGSDGGHNGLGSIIYQLCSEEFPRLRCGIAPETLPAGKDGKRRFVLDQFTPEEEPAVRELVDRSSDVLITAIKESLRRAADRLSIQKT